jgi:ribose transport system substrate-binding protein
VLVATMNVTAVARRGRRWALGAVAVASSVALLACGGSGKSGTGGSASGAGKAGSKLIVLELSFPCGLNEYATKLCAGVRDAGKALPAGFKVQVKTGINYADNVAFNNLIQTSLQLKPGGLIIFPAGPAAQTPVINRACDQGVKIIIIDSPATGVKCQTSFVGADHHQLGVLDGEWLVAHPPASKDVAVVTQPPGEYASTDARVKGFTDTVQAAGFKVVGTAVTDLSLDKTRTQVTNLLTAHPSLGAIFSANSGMGQGTMQALKGNRRVLHLTVDGFVADVPNILKGSISADAAQDPYQMGKIAVQYLAKAIQGQRVPAKTYTSAKVVDRTNAAAFKAAGGLH